MEHFTQKGRVTLTNKNPCIWEAYKQDSLERKLAQQPVRRLISACTIYVPKQIKDLTLGERNKFTSRTQLQLKWIFFNNKMIGATIFHWNNIGMLG